jgi:hypothetical protein
MVKATDISGELSSSSSSSSSSCRSKETTSVDLSRSVIDLLNCDWSEMRPRAWTVIGQNGVNITLKVPVVPMLFL